MKFRLFLLACLFSPFIANAANDHEYQFEEIGGNQIAWSCEGEGSPTIVLIAGSGLDAHGSFSRIYHGYKGAGKICLYDRAGMGLSTFVTPKTRTLNEMASELAGLVESQKWENLILVPHSFGGMVARKYVAIHPEKVRAVLFLDNNHEDWLAMMEDLVSESDWAIMERIMAWNIRTFHEDVREAEASVRDSEFDDQLPITLISRGVPHTQIRLEKMSYAGIRAYEETFLESQRKLLLLSKNSKHVVAEASSHMINDYDPWLVIDEIEQIVNRIVLN